MNVLHLVIAMGPLALYGIALGVIHSSRRPHLTNGTREIYAIALAVSGMVLIGPATMFMPEAVAERLGAGSWNMVAVWCFLMVAYLMLVTLIILLVRPRLVAYNITHVRLRETLEQLLVRYDVEHQWAGDCLAIPSLGVQLQIEPSRAMRPISLIATSGPQSDQGWRRLERALAAELQQIDVTPATGGAIFLGAGLLMLAVLVVSLAMEEPGKIIAALTDLLRP